MEGTEDLKQVSVEEDLTDFTVIQRRRFTKMVQERLSVPTYFGSPSPSTQSLAVSLSTSSSPSMVTCSTQNSADATIFIDEQPPDSQVEATLPTTLPSTARAPLALKEVSVEEDLTDFTGIQRRRFTKMVQEQLSVPTYFGSPSPSTQSLAVSLSTSSSPSMVTCSTQNSADATIFIDEQPPDSQVEATLPTTLPSTARAPLALKEVSVEEDLTDFTGIQRRRFTKMVQEQLSVPTYFGSPSPSTQSFPTLPPTLPSTAQAPLARPYREGTFSIRYCTLQPLFAERKVQVVQDRNPVTMTMQQLVTLICRQEGKGPKVTAELYTFEGVPLFCNHATYQYTLEEWHVTDGSLFWVIFHSTTVEEDMAPPETLPELDAKMGSTQIFIKSTKTITIMVDLASDDGQTLRQKIYSKTRTPTSVISLNYGGRLIHSDQTKLQDYNISQGSTLHMWVSPQKRLYSFWDSMFQVDLCRPIVQQSPSGMSVFNSCLRVLASQGAWSKKTLGYLLHMTECPPLVLALKMLFEKKAINKAHQVAIHECLYQVFRAIVPTDPAMVPPNSSPADGSVFDHSIFCWTHLVANARAEYTAGMDFEEVVLMCSISHKRLIDPIQFTGGSNVFERQAVESRLAKGELIPGLPAGREYTMNDFVTDERIAQMVMACPTEEKSVFLLKPSFTADSLPPPTEPVVDSFITLGSDIPRYLKVYSALDLEYRARDYPCLTLNGERMTVVCTGKSKSDIAALYLYDPATGDCDLHNPDDLAAKVTGVRLLHHPSFSKEGTITRTPMEAIVVILDRSGSMTINMFDCLSRLDIVKELFKTFADRSIAYNYHHVIGLTVFSKNLEVISLASEAFVHFQSALQDVDYDSGTAIWDAMVSAAEQLDAISSTYPDCVKRILCLTDGEDNRSTHEPHKVARMLQDKNIVLDCVLVGQSNTTAKAIAVATSGCAFFPSDHKESLRLFQMETVLSIRERLIGRRKPPVTSMGDLKVYESQVRYPYDKKPQRILPGELEKGVTSPGRVLQRAIANPPNGLAAPSLRRVKRILAEIADYQHNPHPNIETYPCEQQLDFWRLLLVGPSNTPYEGGVFLLYAKFPADYPEIAPEIRFVTPIYHCNVNGHGKICHSVFDRNYSADFSVRCIMDCVFGLLLTPEPEDPLDSALAQEYYDNRQEYERTAATSTREHAGKKLEQWRKELVGSDAPVGGDVPSHLACALSGKLMSDPVMTPYGLTYERSAVEAALRKEPKCPKTGKPLTQDQLIVNFAIREAIEEYKRAQMQTAWYLQ